MVPGRLGNAQTHRGVSRHAHDKCRVKGMSAAAWETFPCRQGAVGPAPPHSSPVFGLLRWQLFHDVGAAPQHGPDQAALAQLLHRPPHGHIRDPVLCGLVPFRGQPTPQAQLAGADARLDMVRQPYVDVLGAVLVWIERRNGHGSTLWPP